MKVGSTMAAEVELPMLGAPSPHHCHQHARSPSASVWRRSGTSALRLHSPVVPRRVRVLGGRRYPRTFGLHVTA